MSLQKLINNTIFSQLLLAVAISLFMFSAPVVSAQTESASIISCPITGGLSAAFGTVLDTVTVDTIFTDAVELTNNSNYVFSNIKAAVAVYQTDQDIVPMYWSVLPNGYQLLAGESLAVSAEVDFSVLPAGEYIIKVFVMQGDVVSLLGGVLNDVTEVDSRKIIKTTPATTAVDFSLSVPDEISVSRGFTLDIVTKNTSQGVLRSDVLGVVTQGSVPLGAAVWSDKTESIILIPDSSRKTEVLSSFILPGSYTAYAALMEEGLLLPIVSTSIHVGEDEGPSSWAYLSKVGVSNYPIDISTEVVACVAYVGEQRGVEYFTEQLAVEFALLGQDGEVLVKNKVTSLAMGQQNYFSIKPQVNASEFTLTTDFFQQQLPTSILDKDAYSAEELLLSTLTNVGTTKQTFTCLDGESCVGSVVPINNPVIYTSTNQKSFWFYLGVTLAALLMMYLMLRRLDPVAESEESLSADELQ